MHKMEFKFQIDWSYIDEYRGWLKEKKILELWLLNVASLTRRVLAPLMCLFVALDVLQKKYENSCFLKFNLLQKRVGGWMQIQEFALAVLLTACGGEFQHNGSCWQWPQQLQNCRFLSLHHWIDIKSSEWGTHAHNMTRLRVKFHSTSTSHSFSALAFITLLCLVS